MQNRTLALLFITNFVTILGFTLIFPLLPFYAREFGASTFQISILFASFALMQFIFSPFWGKISDSIGRKPIILISLIGSVVSFMLFGLAGSFIHLVLIRIFHGFASSAGFPAIQAAGADISTNNDRAKVMGTLGAAFSLSIVFGPALSGILSTISFQLPFFVAAAIALVNLVFVFFLVPETNITRSKKIDFSGSFVLFRVFAALRSKLAPGYLMSSVSHLSFSIMGVAFPLFALEMFGFGPLQVGLVFALLGIVGVIVQVFIVSKAIERYGEPIVMRVGLIFMMISFLLVSFLIDPILSAVVLSLMAIGTALINPANNSYISKKSDKQGVALGTLNSFGSISRVAGPLIVGSIYQIWGPNITFLATAFVVFLGVVISMRIK